jgi:hypothetical protein
MAVRAGVRGDGDRAVSEPLFRVIATNIKSLERRTIAADETEKNAEAAVKMAIMRRGVEEEFFTVERVERAKARGE